MIAGGLLNAEVSIHTKVAAGMMIMDMIEMTGIIGMTGTKTMMKTTELMRVMKKMKMMTLTSMIVKIGRTTITARTGDLTTEDIIVTREMKVNITTVEGMM